MNKILTGKNFGLVVRGAALGLSLAAFGTGAMAATITNGVTPVLGAGNNDVTGQTVVISGDPSSLEVNGGSFLIADVLFSGGPADVTTILFTGAGTTVDLVGDDAGFTNRIDIAGRGIASMTIADGAVVDTKSAACTTGNCNIFIGNFTGSTGSLTVTGAGSRLDGRDSFVIGQSRVADFATDGFIAGTPGGTTNATLDVLDGGVLNTERSTLAREAGGLDALGTEQAIVTATVSGMDSQWNMTGTNAWLNIAQGANSTATLNITLGGKVKVETTGSTARVNVSANGLNGGGAGDLNISGANSGLLIKSDSGNAQLNLGAAGVGTLDMVSSADLAVESNTGGARIFIAGGTTTPAGSDGTANIDNATVSVTANGAASAFISVGRNLGTGELNLTGGTVVTVDNTGSGSSFVNIGRSAAGGNATVSGGSSLVVKATGTGTSSITVGRDANAVGTMTVTGAGSSATVEDFLSIGRDGATGVLNVQSNAIFDNTGGTGLTRVGRSGGTGTLNIRTGGNYKANNLQIGRDSGSSGTVTVTNGGTTVDLGDTLTVGRDGGGTTGAMTITNGGVVNAHTTLVGNRTGSDGTLNLSFSAALNMDGKVGNIDGALLLIGRVGKGVTTVTTGATITVDQGVVPITGLSGGLLLGGSSSDPATTGDGTLNISTGGTVTLKSGFTLIGRQGTGAVNISAGGTLDGSLQNIASVGRKSTGVGTVDITGAGAKWDAGNNLFIGTEVNLGTATATGPGGTGLVNVANGGALEADSIFIGGGGTLSGGDGTITGNVVSEGIMAPGNSPGLMSIFGNLDLTGLSTTELELEGLVFGTQYDRIDVSDDPDTSAIEGILDIAAGATFDVSFFGGFTAGLGDFFDVLVADDITGDISLANFLLPVLSVGLEWDTLLVSFELGREALRLEVVEAQVPEPVSLALFGLGLGAMVVIRRRRKAA